MPERGRLTNELGVVERGGEPNDQRLLGLALDDHDALAVVEEHGSVFEIASSREIEGDVGSRFGTATEAPLRSVDRRQREALDPPAGEASLYRRAEDRPDEQHYFLRPGGRAPTSASRADRHTPSRTTRRA